MLRNQRGVGGAADQGFVVRLAHAQFHSGPETLQRWNQDTGGTLSLSAAWAGRGMGASRGSYREKERRIADGRAADAGHSLGGAGDFHHDAKRGSFARSRGGPLHFDDAIG